MNITQESHSIVESMTGMFGKRPFFVRVVYWMDGDFRVEVCSTSRRKYLKEIYAKRLYQHMQHVLYYHHSTKCLEFRLRVPDYKLVLLRRSVPNVIRRRLGLMDKERET